MDTMLHIYGQSSWHFPVYIVGDKEALTKLRDIISQVIESNDKKEISEFSGLFSINDGEGYILEVVMLDSNLVGKLAVPYYSKVAKEKRTEALYPFRLRKYFILNKKEIK